MTELVLVAGAMAAGGAALAREEGGRVVFVEGALPGERVRARVTAAKKDFARAVAVEILDPSPDRVAPPCPALAAGCGGCTWQHVSPAAQARLKAGIVVDALRRIAKLSDPPAPVPMHLDGPALRTTARLAVSPTGRAGHRPHAGTGAVETDGCLVAHPLLEELIVAGRYPGAGEVLLRVSVATGERLVLVDAGARRVEVPAGVAVFEEGDRREACVTEDAGGRRFRISAGSFFQPGPVVADALAAAVDAAIGEALGAGDVLVDLYAGVGLFASTIGAGRATKVIAIESDPSAVADARVNLADLDATVVAAEVARWKPRPAGVVVADPSRSGLGRPGTGAVAATGAGRVVLVSCDPASMARDTVLLGGAGYRLMSVALVDAFPHTFHTETVARFDRQAGA
ncbi:MAG: class I SAM-dependent RNA methyltransferase [Acidimicrobiales bacterium]